MRTLKHPLVVLLFPLLAPQTTAAQGTFERPLPPGGANRDPSAIVAGTRKIPESGILSVEPFESSRPVLGLPYSADSVTTVTQRLADGNRISNHTSASMARDSHGRTRREHQAVFLGAFVAERQVPLVTISDPGTGTYITLDQERKVAFMALRRSPGVNRAPAAPTSGPADFDVAVSAEFASRTAAVERNSATTQLGEKEVEGLRVVGTSTTMIIPAAAVGNELPIEVTSERWYSPDLQIVVISRRTDPRFGETLYRVTNIRRTEPPRSFFEVPPGFRIETQERSR